MVTLPYSVAYPKAFRLKTAAKPAEVKEPAKAEKTLIKGAERSVYRLYNPHSGDHLYTQSFEEAATAIKHGWINEGIAWTAPKEGAPVTRLYNPQSGLHHYTLDANEIKRLTDLGWKKAGIAFFSGGPNSVYRMYNPGNGSHLLSAKRTEHDYLSRIGWYCEGTDTKY